MSAIGTFTKGKDGIIEGKVVTLTLNTRAVFTPIEKDAPKTPDYRLTFANADHIDVEVGAAWMVTGAAPRQRWRGASFVVVRTVADGVVFYGAVL